MTVQQTQLFSISDLLHKLQYNNHGETQNATSSTPSSFDVMLKGLIPQPQKRTSLEEESASKVSPDYSHDKEFAAAGRQKSVTERKIVNESHPDEDEENSKAYVDSEKTEYKSLDSNKQKPEENRNVEKEDSQRPIKSDKKQDTTETEKDTVEVRQGQKGETSKTRHKEESSGTKETDSKTDASKTGNEDEEKVDETKIVNSLTDLLKALSELLNKMTQTDGETSGKEELNVEINNLINDPKFADLKSLFSNQNTTQTQASNTLVDFLKQAIQDSAGNEDLSKALSNLVSALNDKSIDMSQIQDLMNQGMETSQDPEENDFLNQLNDFLIKVSNKESTQPSLSKTSTQQAQDIADSLPKEPEQNAHQLPEDLKQTLGLKTIKKESTEIPHKEKTETMDVPADQTLDKNPPEVVDSKPKNLPEDLLKKIVDLNKTDEDSKISDQNKIPQVDVQNEVKVADSKTVAEVQAVNQPKIAVENTQSNQDATRDMGQNAILDKTATEKSTQAEMKPEARFSSYLTKAFNAENEIVDRIVTQANMKLVNGNKEISFNLLPPELGKVKVSIVDNNGVISGKIQVETDAIKEIVQSNLHQLKSSLNENLKVDKLEVEVQPDSSGNSMLKNSSENSGADNPAFRERERAYGVSAGNNENEQETSFGLEIPLPKGVVQRQNGLVSVDLIG